MNAKIFAIESADDHTTLDKLDTIIREMAAWDLVEVSMPGHEWIQVRRHAVRHITASWRWGAETTAETGAAASRMVDRLIMERIGGAR